jgi:hypothetical protein
MKSGLQINQWWHAITVFGAAASIAALAAPIDKLIKGPVLLLALGMFFCGIGEWINHPLQTFLMPQSASFPAGVITGHPRRNSPIGGLFNAVGLIMLAVGLVKFLLRA